ncbi:hypothetical protein GWK36_13435 [Caldichromatium japonicum]|uniref:Uncharacterized protein n=1 Tax=Caldichromatium japonicum TaxID=2699430 RepID=A0A6G7VFQ1_9GAMM|nr:hypothetical protein [Caldichromatium japonicum]QIK38814.1 hypothetical protein GWK36_13435 [Caldichromatium japonicum]
MDSEAWRETYAALNERPCPFEQAILSGSAGCTQAQHLCIGERQGVQCASDQARVPCLDLLKSLKEQSRFALKALDPQEALPHNQALRVQIGGLRGLRTILNPQISETAPILDISALLGSALDRFGSFAALPSPLILRAIARYHPRRSRRFE